MRILTYNVHSCRGTDGKLLPERIAEVIAATEADVVCLQELDAHRVRTGRVHQARRLAELLTMEFAFHPAIQVEVEEYGDAILSRHPMQLVRAGRLPRPSRLAEPRGALWVEVQAHGQSWQILNTHFGLARGERRQQAAALAEWARDACQRAPAIVCGDLNSRPGSRVHQLLGPGLREAQRVANGGQRKTFSTRFPWICLDYIYLTEDIEVLAAQVVDSPLVRLASDHFPLLAELAPVRASARAGAAPPPAVAGAGKGP